MFVAIAFVLDVEPGDAHKPITSPYTFNDDVFPILRDRCGKCHVSGGVAPMSLMTHAEAVPWGESIRTEILAGHMPPGSVDEAPSRFRNAPGLSPREMNLLLTWVTGGTPIGVPTKIPRQSRATPAGDSDRPISRCHCRLSSWSPRMSASAPPSSSSRPERPNADGCGPSI